MSYPPQPGQWGPGAPSPGSQPPPPSYYSPPGWGPQQPPPPKQNNGLKWLLVIVAVLLVIAISVGVTLFFTRDGSGDGGQTSTSSTPTASDIASADDTGPVAIITADPTCDSWRALQNTLAAAQSNGWSKRDPTIPASEWTPDQRTQFETVGNTMRTTADQAVALAKQTPHRVMRELYEQFVAYGRAYADSLPSYEVEDDAFARSNVNFSSTISTICDAIENGVIGRASSAPPASNPSQTVHVGDPDNPDRFLTSASSACTEWITQASSFDSEMLTWSQTDPEIPASEWTPEQRGVQDAAARTFDEYSSKIEAIGRKSGNAVLEDFASLIAQYFRVYSIAIPTYTDADYYLVNPGLRLRSAILNACQAATG